MRTRFRLTTFQVIALGFIALILIGSLLLMLPFASRTAGSASFADCLFTATSAVCVTGLVVQDTATYWTSFGQAVILLLIQIGGMGVVTAAITLSFISGRKIGLMQRAVMRESISAPQVGGIVRLTRFIVLSAIVIELIGTLVLLPAFVPLLGWGRGLWYAAFHAISAFCNAGFDLMGIQGKFSSLTGFSHSPWINLGVILLIIVGGIGFLVWNDVRTHGLHFRQYRLQSKLVLVTSAVLILIPFVSFMVFEMKELSFSERLIPAFFQSVTLRTAGFNTVDLAAMSDGSQALMIVWMLIGGSPGSTAGGMKTTTVAVLLLTSWSVFRRRESVAAFGRRMEDSVIRNAVAIMAMYILLFTAGGMIISRLESLPMLTCMFETASAIGTVGLTLGITSRLGLVSRGILVVMMFMGRVGGLTLIYAAQQSQPTHSAFPLERITIG